MLKKLLYLLPTDHAAPRALKCTEFSFRSAETHWTLPVMLFESFNCFANVLQFCKVVSGAFAKVFFANINFGKVLHYTVADYQLLHKKQ